jgi:hypothetical protein
MSLACSAVSAFIASSSSSTETILAVNFNSSEFKSFILPFLSTNSFNIVSI